MKCPLVFVLIVALAIPALAQTQPTPLRDAANREVMRLARTVDTAAPQATQVQQRSWAARHPALTGTLIGLGIGFPIGVATCKFPGAEGSSCASYTYPANARMFGGNHHRALGGRHRGWSRGGDWALVITSAARQVACGQVKLHENARRLLPRFAS